ncbi:roadblock/LC7 domain-containing protein [Streptomyces hesseae]|uniref:Roadblock/LC7 domain-containing protein n=1 Tax=Streptomyces hesseae TaxID=3075519 RepID=A0ABU2SXU0_9ACTN|nr:roadblock/LC7 domain-containing protein [Streptomyces sp. DSM 40473]MDT0453771.1 roadblock/LC7 domain-containing protein [Streptomyces sp. DSM 40473]
MSSFAMVQARLDLCMQSVAGLQGVLVAGLDGFPGCESGFASPSAAVDAHDHKARSAAADHRAAAVSVLAAAASQVAQRHGAAEAGRICIETERGFVLVCKAGEQHVVGLYAGREARLEELGFTLSSLAGQVGEVLAVKRPKASPDAASAKGSGSPRPCAAG